MPTVTFIEPDGTPKQIEARPGESLMLAATREGVRGIVAECGGSAMCATCHCYLEQGELPPKGELEEETIEILARNLQPNSRLTCQVVADEELHGVVLRVAPA